MVIEEDLRICDTAISIGCAVASDGFFDVDSGGHRPLNDKANAQKEP